VKSHDCELRYVYITHPHADHFLGLPEILAAFPEARPVALSESIPAMEEQISPGYMQVWGGFFSRPADRQARLALRRWQAPRSRSEARRPR
jgi:glyoxylase-like metal-dependent hydrolase (beta-lactamase superfamily II)